MTGRVAVIGGGIGGLTAAYLLSRRYDVTLFEKETRLGGNAYTLDTKEGHRVDIAVAAFGRAGYPHFYRLLAELGVRAAISPGAFTSSCDLDTREGFYMTLSPAGLVAQRFDLLRPRRLRELLRLRSGLRHAMALLHGGGLESSLEEALARIPELASGAPRRMLLLALCLLSSMSCDEVLAAPASFFFEKLAVHSDVISPRAFTSVRCIPGGTRRYVDAMRGRFTERTGDAVRSVVRGVGGVTVISGDGRSHAFDHVVLACNADQALALLEDPTEREQELLGAWRYKDGSVVVHGDHSSFPPPALIQAYTFLYSERGGRLETSVNGCLWREPGVSKRCRLIASQHPNFPIREDLVEHRVVLRTPLFGRAACRTRTALATLNGVRGTYFCGSYFGYGLHEDAVTSAIAVARALGVEPTF